MAYLDSHQYVYTRYIMKSRLPSYVKPRLNETHVLMRANGLHVSIHLYLNIRINAEGSLEVVHQKEFM